MTTATLPAGYTLRRPTMDDVHGLFELENASDVTRYGEPDIVEEDVRSVLLNQSLNSDCWVVIGEQEAIIAYGGVHATEYGRIFVNLSVLPEHRHRGVGNALHALIEARGRELIAHAAEGARVTLNGLVYNQDLESRHFVERAGCSEVRHAWRMQIDLNEEPPTPHWPEGIALRTFERGRDERAVFDAAEEAFSDHWGHVPNKYDEWANWTFNRGDFDPTLWFLAVETDDPDRIAGFALDWVDPWQGWVGTLGVLRPYRKRGLAQALLYQSFGEFWRRGVHKVVLGVDSQNLTGATRLYQRVGMCPVRQWDTFQKELRPGRDLSVTSLAEG
jgi:mycothiol synthase